MPSPLYFITANPATEAYDHRMQVNAEQELRDIEMEGKQLALQEQRELMPYRISEAKDTSRLRTVQADVAEKTAPFDISAAQTQSEQGQFNLDRDRQFLPYELAGKEADATKAQVEAEFARPKAEADLAQSQVSIAALQASAANSWANAERARAWKEEKFLALAADDPDAAEAWAASSGFEVPQEMRAFVRDRKIMARIKGMIEGVNERMPGDENVLERDKEYERLFGKYFAPQEVGGDGRSRGDMMESEIPGQGDLMADVYGADATDPAEKQPKVTGERGGNTVFDRKYAMWFDTFVAQGVDKETANQRALEIASGFKQYSQAQMRIEANKAARGEVAGTFGTAEQKAAMIKQREEEIFQGLLAAQSDGLVTDAGAGGGATSATAATPQQTMKGPDGNDYPVVTDQAGYDALESGATYYHADKKKFLVKK